ncbi:MAG TPA: MFS transporter [Kineosporiaceae bacterium]
MTSERMRVSWLTRNVVVLSVVSLMQDAASELLYPILPIFLTGTLGAPAAVVGLVEGVAEGAASLTKLAAGGLVRHYPRRRLVGVGYGLAALGKLLVALAPAWPLVASGRAVDRLGKGLRGAPRDAMLVDGVPVNQRGRVFGVHRTADTTGAVIGPLLGLAAYHGFAGRIRPVLAVAVVPAVLSVLLVALARDERRPRPEPGPTRPLAVLRSVLHPPAGLGRPYWRVVALVTGFALVNFPDALVLLRLGQIGFALPAVVLAYVLYNAVYALASLPAGAFADRFGPAPVFAAGVLFFALGYLGLAVTSDHTAAWVLMAVYGLYAGCTDGVGKAWASRLLGEASQSAGQGFLQGLAGLATLAAGIWAGVAWDAGGGHGRWPLAVSGAVALLLAAVVLAAHRADAGRRRQGSAAAAGVTPPP